MSNSTETAKVKSSKKLYALSLFLLALNLVTLILALVYLPINWDEGWNFCVAKNWLTINHYGCSISGLPTTPRLSTGWPTVILSKLGFQAFGVGYIQGRIFVALLSFSALIMLFFLSKRLWGLGTATLTLLFLTILSGDFRVHPMLLGAVAWGELPMILFILLGYFLLSLVSLPFGLLASIPAGFLFAFAIQIKIQAYPFIMLALSVPVLGVCSAKHRKLAFAFLICLVQVYFWKQRGISIPLPSLPNISEEGVGVHDIVDILAKVTSGPQRVTAIIFSISEHWVYIPAYLLMFIRFYQSGLKVFSPLNEKLSLIGFSLFLLSLSWFGWFVLLAIDFPRYLAPAVIFGSPFLALLFTSLATEYGYLASFQSFKKLIQTRGKLPIKSFCVFLLTWTSLTGLASLYNIYSYLWVYRNDNQSLLKTVDFINTETAQNSLIETYDSQFYFLLNRPFHYPPDQLHLDLLRRSADPDLYEPTNPRPDYYLIGPWTRENFRLYRKTLESGQAVLVNKFEPFELYNSNLSKSVPQPQQFELHN